MEKEPYQVGERVTHRATKKEGLVLNIMPQARRRIEWDDARITVTHIGDLAELVH